MWLFIYFVLLWCADRLALRESWDGNCSALPFSMIVPVTKAKSAPPRLQAEVAQELVAQRTTKASVLRTLCALGKRGLLQDLEVDETNLGGLKRQLTEVSAYHSEQMTPYGPVVQEMEIGAPNLKYWEYANPFALLYYMTKISPYFARLMESIHVEGQPLRIVIYGDEITPGNPFRPDMGRKMLCIYWCIAEWPQHVLQRSFAWPVFSIIRSSIVQGIEGGISRSFRLVLHIFFMDANTSFINGIHINGPSGGHRMTAVFGGFLADLLGHKEITDWKGTGGVMACMECDNILNMQHRRVPKEGEYNANCSDTRKFHRCSDADIFKKVDDLAALKGTVGQGKFEKAETKAGFNYVPNGLMRDLALRAFYTPVKHQIRDWQHICAQDGVCNTHVFNVIKTLKSHCDIKIDTVQEFSQICHYPSIHGKLEKAAFAQQRMRTYTIASFSSIMLTMVSVLMLFLEVTVESVIPEHVDAFRIMFHIIGLLRAGPVDALKHAESLRVLFANHMEAVVKLYGDYVKPKGHQAFHIVDGMYALDRLLSCFVTERKHKIIKSAAVYVFRHLEHTVLQDVLSTHMRQITDGHDLYSATFLICPFDVILGGIAFRRARSGCVRIGHVSAGDLVITTDGRVGKILSLWQRVADEHTFLEVDSYPSINNDTRFRATTRATKDFFESAELVDALIYVDESPGIIRFSLPAQMLYDVG